MSYERAFQIAIELRDAARMRDMGVFPYPDGTGYRLTFGDEKGTSCVDLFHERPLLKLLTELNTNYREELDYADAD